MKKTLFIIILMLPACGFELAPELALNNKKNALLECNNLYITDSYALNTTNEISAKQVFKVEKKDYKDKNRYNNYPVYNSYINNNNYITNISVHKNLKQKACRDNYLKNIEYLDQ